uniref:C-type lectin domain-containing protein n=1 Tax=Salarias fasciatus TaxID=181472 RepID=A0A672FKF1_SALFA
HLFATISLVCNHECVEKCFPFLISNIFLSFQPVCEGLEGSPTFHDVNIPLAWHEAHDYCKQHYSTLAIVRNQAENDWCQRLTGTRDSWIGFFKETWFWSDNSPLTSSMWREPEEPNGIGSSLCSLFHEGVWEDDDCKVEAPFVCSSGEL